MHRPSFARKTPQRLHRFRIVETREGKSSFKRQSATAREIRLSHQYVSASVRAHMHLYVYIYTLNLRVVIPTCTGAQSISNSSGIDIYGTEHLAARAPASTRRFWLLLTALSLSLSCSLRTRSIHVYALYIDIYTLHPRSHSSPQGLIASTRRQSCIYR